MFNFTNPFCSIKKKLSSSELLQSYVNAGILLANAAVVPLSKLLKHLLVIQKIDPNIQPGERERQIFQQQLDASFQDIHKEDYDGGFSWANKKFAEFSDQWKNSSISKKDFLKMTDLTNELDRLVEKCNVGVVPSNDGRMQQSLHDTVVLSDILKGGLNEDDLAPEEIRKLMDRTDELKETKRFIDDFNKSGQSLPSEETIRFCQEKELLLQELINKNAPMRQSVVQDTTLLSVVQDTKLLLARELVNEMVIRGLCDDNEEEIKEHINQILNFDALSFNSLKSVVLEHPISDKKDDFFEKAKQSALDWRVERLNKLIQDGSVSTDDLDTLVSEGLEQSVVDAWCKKCTKEFSTKKVLKTTVQARDAKGRFKGSFKRRLK